MATDMMPATLTKNEIFPPFPEPTDSDFDDDIREEEKQFYLDKFKDINSIIKYRLHCTACDRHLGCSINNESRMKCHPMLRTLICQNCHKFYNSGEFDRGEDGSELYCRWCGQGGQVYCCSDCVHVFCAKCIKRNLGTSKIKEIENMDDWKCFKCSPKCLWDSRAVCWALLRYCDLRTKLINTTEDEELKKIYTKASVDDLSECCNDKKKRPILTPKPSTKKKKDEKDTKKSGNDTKVKPPSSEVINTIAKIPSGIQVKKFASVSGDTPPKTAQKRTYSQITMSKPIAIAPLRVPLRAPMVIPAKRIKVIPPPPMSFRPQFVTYPVRPRAPLLPPPSLLRPMLYNHQLANGFDSAANDNLNLSLESLTQGLDFQSVGMNNDINAQENDVVCTPDFLPLEPLCEVTEDNDDDDVECITPAVPAPKRIPKAHNKQNIEIIQMTEKDVSVNSATGGLKFRVDPQTLSSNKMYRLPDGRVFSINVNPNLPGGYSATIVSMDKNKPKDSQTYAAKVTPVMSKSSSPKPKRMPNQPTGNKKSNDKRRESNASSYRYSLIDAIDSLEYSLLRLKTIQRKSTESALKTKTQEEVRRLTKTLDQVLKISAKRFEEIRSQLNSGSTKCKPLHSNQNHSEEIVDEDDDDVEILSNNDDPIYIDENSVDNDVSECQKDNANDLSESQVDNANIISVSQIDDDANQSTITVDNERCSSSIFSRGLQEITDKSDEKTQAVGDVHRTTDINIESLEKTDSTNGHLDSSRKDPLDSLTTNPLDSSTDSTNIEAYVIESTSKSTDSNNKLDCERNQDSGNSNNDATDDTQCSEISETVNDGNECSVNPNEQVDLQSDLKKDKGDNVQKCVDIEQADENKNDSNIVDSDEINKITQDIVETILSTTAGS